MSSPGPSDAALIRARRAEPDGTRMFNIHCASCHGELGNAPGIVSILGAKALTGFGDERELFDYTHTEMPPDGKAENLSEDEHWAVVRYMIRASREGGRL